MNKKYWTILFLLLPVLAYSQNLYNSVNSKKFANFLYNSQEYALAAAEFERISFLDSSDFQSGYMLLKSYRKSQQYNKGLRRAESFLATPEFLTSKLQNEYVFLLIKNGSYSKAGQFLGEKSKIPSGQKDFLQLSMLLMYGDYQKAGIVGGNIGESADVKTVGLKRLASEAALIEFKNPGLSLVLSGVVPGLGKVYAGQWKDGLISFLFIGAAVYQAYRGFDKKGTSSAYGWIYAGLGTGFYLGNLYGSYKAVNKYNHKQRHDIYHRTEKIFDSMD
jgi:hypothetical protein